MTALAKVRLSLALACLAGYGVTLTFKEFVRDDQWLIERNPLMHGGLATLPALLTTGYFEAADGLAAPIQEYRPLLSLTYFLHVATTGNDKRPMHAANLFLHLAVCWLLLEVLRRRISLAAAAAGSLIFAVLPVHAEAVSYITSRSELLSAALMLAAWLLLDKDKPRIAPASGLFFCSLLTKESAVLFPAFLALSDWTFHGQLPWEKRKVKIHAALLACVSAYMVMRFSFLSRSIHAGVPYFHGKSTLITLLTVARFAAEHYLLSALTGLGLCADFSRPLIPDSSIGSLDAWFYLGIFTTVLGCSLVGLRRRKAWAFWLLGPILFLAPTSHLIIPIDTIGAHRLLYVPSFALAWGFGRLYERCPARIGGTGLGILGLWYLLSLSHANKAWSSELNFYQAAIACNPVSAKLRSALGAYWFARGETALGMSSLNSALALDPESDHAYYNLSRAALDKKDYPSAEKLARRALGISPSADSWVVLSLAVEQQGRREEAADCLTKALAILPWHPVAHYNAGRIAMLRRDHPAALRHFSRFLEFAPKDPDAPGVRRLVAHLSGKR